MDESISYFEKASEQMPKNGRVHYNRAIALQSLNRPQEAEQAYRQALKIESENPDYLYGIVTLYVQQENYEQALIHAEKLADLLPGNVQIQQLIESIEREM